MFLSVGVICVGVVVFGSRINVGVKNVIVGSRSVGDLRVCKRIGLTRMVLITRRGNTRRSTTLEGSFKFSLCPTLPEQDRTAIGVGLPNVISW